MKFAETHVEYVILLQKLWMLYFVRVLKLYYTEFSEMEINPLKTMHNPNYVQRFSTQRAVIMFQRM
jgi:hypothetical protein